MTGQADFSAYLAEVMERRSLRASQVAAYARVSPSVVTQWQRGARPKPESLRKLAEGLGVTYEELARAAGYSDAVSAIEPALPPTANPATSEEAMVRLAELALPGLIRRVPVQEDWAHAGEGGEGVQYVFVPPQLAGRNIAAVPVRGKCMEPAIKPGTIVFVDRDAKPRQGGLVMALVEGAAMVRIYDGEGGMLIANDGSKPVPIKDATNIVRVVGIYMDAE